MHLRPRINKNEAKILNMIGRNADISRNEIASTVNYKRTDTVTRKLRRFREIDIIRGPYYDLNLGAIAKNQLYNIYGIITFDPENCDLVFEVLTTVPGCRYIFPSTDLDRFFVYFQCNHYRNIGILMKTIQKRNLIEHKLFTSQYKWIKRNPNFFGSPIPPSEGLLNNCRIPDISHMNICPNVKWNSTDLTVMQYLQVWSDSPVEIARREFKWHNNFLSYDRIRHSIQKIKKSNIIESKDYHLSPLPRGQCSTVLVLLSSKKKRALLRIMENFGKGCRLHKSYTLAGNTGILFCWMFPEAATNILDAFDRMDFLYSRMYYLRSHKSSYLYHFSFEPQMFNTDKQRWEFPYLKVKNKAEKLLSSK